MKNTHIYGFFHFPQENFFTARYFFDEESTVRVRSFFQQLISDRETYSHGMERERSWKGVYWSGKVMWLWGSVPLGRALRSVKLAGDDFWVLLCGKANYAEQISSGCNLPLSTCTPLINSDKAIIITDDQFRLCLPTTSL